MLTVLTVAFLGILRLLLYRSSDASLVLLITKSTDGPISSSSILGVRLPDFFIKILHKEETGSWIGDGMQLFRGSRTLVKSV